MSGIYLFGLASRHINWLSERQSVVAENVANVSTPGYAAKDVAGFTQALESTRLAMIGTDPLHMSDAGTEGVGVEQAGEKTWDITHSGNSVSLEQEMLKAGEVSRFFSLDTAVAKSFHRMFLTSLKA